MSSEQLYLRSLMGVYLKDKVTGKRERVVDYAGPNLHENFLDMNEEERREKDRIAKELAQKWVDKLGKHLVDIYTMKLQEAIREKFRQSVHAGTRFSMKEIKRMDTLQKKDYFDEIIAYDERVQKYVQKSHKKLLKESFIMDDVKGEMRHQFYIWQKSRENFNKLMEEKIRELGYHPEYTDMGEEKKYQLKISYFKKDQK